jgi:hypothetical protein
MAENQRQHAESVWSEGYIEVPFALSKRRIKLLRWWWKHPCLHKAWRRLIGGPGSSQWAEECEEFGCGDDGAL